MLSPEKASPAMPSIMKLRILRGRRERGRRRGEGGHATPERLGEVNRILLILLIFIYSKQCKHVVFESEYDYVDKINEIVTVFVEISQNKYAVKSQCGLPGINVSTIKSKVVLLKLVLI